MKLLRIVFGPNMRRANFYGCGDCLLGTETWTNRFYTLGYRTTMILSIGLI